MPSTSRLQVGSYTVDLNRRTATNGEGTALPLRWRHFEALKTLVEADQEVVTKEQFFERLWPGQDLVDESNLTQCISQLRKALGNGHSEVAYIETVPRIGYRLVAPIQWMPDTDASGDARDRVPAATQVSEPVVVTPAAESPPQTNARRNRVAFAAAAVVLVASGVAIGWRLQPAAAPATSPATAARERGEALLRSGDAAAAVREFQQAVRLDPSDARAFSALAHGLHRQNVADSVPRPKGPSASVDAARQAVLLDSACGGCQGTLGFYLFYHDWEWRLAETHLAEAIRLEPATEGIRPSYALLLTATGRMDQALEQIEFALSKRPYELTWHTIRAAILYSARRYPEAVEAADKALTLDDSVRAGWEWRSKALWQMGRGAEAVKALAQEAFAQHSAALDAAVQSDGPQGGLRELLKVTGDWRGRSEQSWRRIAWRALLGDDEGALDELERAFDMRNVNLMYLGVDPAYDRLRAQPRFQRVLSEMGLAEYASSAAQ